MKKFANIVFIIVSIITILEYIFIFGMFTGPIVMGLTFIVGLINIIFSIKKKNYNEALLYLIATIGLSMGYWKVML